MTRHSFFATILVACATLLFLAERALPQWPWTVVQGAGAVCALFYIWLVYQQQREVLFTSFYQVFYWLGLLASSIAISTGAYMIEIEKTGTANGTFWVAIGFFVAGMEMTVLGYRTGAKGLPGEAFRVPLIDKLVLFAATAGALSLSAYIVLVYGGPIFAGTDRVTFYRQIAPWVLAYVPTIVTQAFFFAAFYFLASAREKKNLVPPGLVVLAFVMAGLFALGEKFSLYIVYVNAWLFLVAALLPNFSIRRSHLVIAISLFLAALAVVAWTYAGSGRGAGFIFGRVALQAQLLWSVVNGGVQTADWSCFFGCGEFATGRDYISDQFLPSHRFNHYQSMGNSLSGFMPALPLLTFGFVGTCCLYLALSFSLGWLQRKAVEAFARDNMLYGFLIFKAQLGLSTIVATASLSPLPGVALVLVVAVIWRMGSAAMAKPNPVTATP